jgi:tetratricopeptide (TPR) repeat protein
MRTLLSRATQADPSFNIGLGLVVILAIAEIFAATYYYIGRLRTARMSAQAVAATLAPPPASSSVTPATAPAVAQPSFSPETIVPTPPLSLVDQLLREGIELRDRGDTTNALARLQEALESDPRNTAVLEEIAKTYESMQLFDRSNETWRKLQEIGPSAGAAYELANQRLKLGVPTPATAETGNPNASLDAASQKKVGGIPADSSFSITDVTTTETPDPDAETNLTMRIGIKKQTSATIDHTKVKIQVFFYDTVGDKDIKLTDADVNYEWLTSKHDWTDTNPEMLSVTYVRPKIRNVSSEAALSEAAATVRPGQKGQAAKGRSSAEGGARKYLGYRILVYYNDQLQAVEAEPTRLLELFPPSESISPP